MRILKTNHTKSVVVVLSVTCLGLGASSVLAGGSVFKFKDDSTTSYQDYPPASKLDIPHSVLSGQGVEVRQVLTREQKRQKAIKERAEREQAERDRVLLALYGSESEITHARDDRIGLVDGLITRLDRRIKILGEQLEGAQARAEAATEATGEVPQYLKAEIQSLEKKIENAWTMMNTRSQDRVDLTYKFAADLARFRELRLQAKLDRELANSDL